MIATWDDVIAFVEETFGVAIRGDGWLGVRQHGQKVRIERLEALGETFVTVVTEVVREELLGQPGALALNHALAVGALELDEGQLLLRATVPLDPLGESALRRIIVHVARQAAHMRARLALGAAPALVFAHYAG